MMTRDANTKRIVPDPAKFPTGISGLATQIHALGLKIGIYRSAILILKTCTGSSWLTSDIVMLAQKLVPDTQAL